MLTELLCASRSQLRALLAAGHPIDPSSLDDTRYRGVSLGLPSAVERLTWKTFRKVFHRDPKDGSLRGWNVRLEQRGLDGPSVPLQRRGAPISFGHYRVDRADEARARGCPLPPGCDRGLLLDYGAGGNPRLDPTSLVRDPLVALRRDDPSLLLGWTFLKLGRRAVPTPSFFALAHEGPLDDVVTP